MVIKILFVCTGNVDRSRTAQEMFDGVEDVKAKSAGTSITAPTKLSKELIDWADVVFVMEYKHQKTVLKLNPEAWRKVECLDIPDIYAHGEPELKKLLIERLRPYMKPSKARTQG